MTLWSPQPSKQQKSLQDEFDKNEAGRQDLINLHEAHIKLLKLQEKIQLDQQFSTVQITTLVGKFIKSMNKQLTPFEINKTDLKRIQREAEYFQHEQQNNQYQLALSSMTALTQLIRNVNDLRNDLSRNTKLGKYTREGITDYLTSLRSTLEHCELVLAQHEYRGIPPLVAPKDFD